MPSDVRETRSSGIQGAASSSEETPLSPELILVAPPEEARLARERLPESSASEWRAFLGRVRMRSALAAEIRPATQSRPERTRKRRRPLVLALLLLTGVALAFGVARIGGDTASTSGSANALGRATERTPPVTSPGSQVQTTPGKAAQPKRRTGRRAATTEPGLRQKASPPAAPSNTRSSAFVPSRAWAWVARPGSATYVFRLFRNGRRVFEARTKKSQLILPKRFRFAAGRYRWSVRSLGSRANGRPAKLLVDSKFALSAAAAAKANG